MLFAINTTSTGGENDNNSSHSKREMKQSSSSSADHQVGQQAQAAAPLFSIHHPPQQPLFQVSEHSSTNSASAAKAPLFSLSGGQESSINTSTNSARATAAEAACEAGQLAPLWNTASSAPAAATASPTTTNAPLFSLCEHQPPPAPLFKLPRSSSELISVGSSSASNSASSFFASPGGSHTTTTTTGTSSSSHHQPLHRASSMNHQHGMEQNRACASSSNADYGGPISFPTLHQVKQQSSLRRLNAANNRNLTDKQKATLGRVTRLAARLCGLPVAAVTGVAASSSSSSGTEADPLVLAQHGLSEIAWRTQAMRVLRMGDLEAQRSSGVAFYEHFALLKNGQQRVGTLTLMGRESRPSLSPDERADLEDLVFLATQSLVDDSQQHHPSQTKMRRQVSNTSSSESHQQSHNHNNSNSHNISSTSNHTTSHTARRRRRSSRDATPMEHTDAMQMMTAMDMSTTDFSCSAQEEADPSKCIIACTAHDLLTPLMGLQLSLSLLQEDPKFVRHLEEQPLQRESFWTAWQSTEVMFRMCQTTIDTLRANKAQAKLPPPSQVTPVLTEVCNLDVTVLLQSLQRLMDPIPKQVPLTMTLASVVPNQVPIITTVATPAMDVAAAAASHSNSNSNTVDWHILRCALTVLSHACRVSTGESKQTIQMRIRVEEDRLVVECEHDCDVVDIQEDEPSSLALQSVAHQMQSVHQGQHGFERDEANNRALFWFSVPVSPTIVTCPTNHHGLGKEDRVITLLPQSAATSSGSGGNCAGHMSTSSFHDMPTLAPMRDSSEPEHRRSSMVDMKLAFKVGKAVPNPTLKTQKSLSPLQGRGLRRLRRSSTGSTNTLGSRRRTFHDMAGLRNDDYGNTIPSNHSQVPLVLPTMIKAQSTATAILGICSPGYSNKGNFRYPANKKKRSTHGMASGAANTTTAHSAMAAAFQASLHASNPLNTTFLQQQQGPDNRIMSFSILQEQQQLDKEKLQPLFMGDGAATAAANAAAASAAVNSNSMSASERNHASRGGSGLDRCFKDLMGTSARTAADEIPQRIRERLHRTSGTKQSLGLSSSPSSQRERKALVIEDSLVIRKTVARALTKLGIHTVVQACDGLEGVARMQEDVFDITLCDFSMPNLGGIDCVKQYRQWEKNQLHQNRPKQYIVGMSAHASPHDIAQGLHVGMNEYHPKPLTIKRLTELLASPPLQEAKSALDRVWQQEQPQSQPTMPLAPAGAAPAAASTVKASLFADFTSSTVTMLDAMNASGRSDTARMDSNSVSRPKTGPLFSMVTN